jgi:Recombination endonuclease VII
MEIITLKEAKSIGQSWYFTGKPCPRGHLSRRYVSGTRCGECQVEKSIQYEKENRSKVKGKRHKRQGLPIATRPMPDICESCKEPETKKTKEGKIRSLCLDHDHETGAFRGWICDSCNRLLRYSITYNKLLLAAQYLKNNTVNI